MKSQLVSVERKLIFLRHFVIACKVALALQNVTEVCKSCFFCLLLILKYILSVSDRGLSSDSSLNGGGHPISSSIYLF